MIAVEIAQAIGLIAQEDLHLLISERKGHFLASAENQDFGEFFARDALIASMLRFFIYERQRYKTGLLPPIKSSLRTIALYQGTTVDDWRDEEPGKTLHELRYEPVEKNQERLELLRKAGWPVEGSRGNMFMRYYGSVDSTPLFVWAGCKYIALDTQTGADFFQEIDPNLREAIDWIKTYGDKDGDLFIEFEAKNRNALIWQGWKDSGDSIKTAEGLKPKEPIALVEVQGYQYAALVNASQLYKDIDPEYADMLARRAAALKEKFNKDFWMEEEGFFAYALDGDKNQIKDITSNVGHLLITGIIDEDKKDRVVKRLMQPDMLTRFGIRTLSSESPNFILKEPFAYHNSSIWPHDNAIIYIGLIENGYYKEAEIVGEGVLSAEYYLFKTYGIRNPELYNVSLDGKILVYRGAQQPQTWPREATGVFTELSLLEAA